MGKVNDEKEYLNMKENTQIQPGKPSGMKNPMIEPQIRIKIKYNQSIIFIEKYSYQMCEHPTLVMVVVLIINYASFVTYLITITYPSI